MNAQQIGEITSSIYNGFTLKRSQFHCDCGTDFEALVTTTDPLCRKCDLKRQEIEYREQQRQRKAEATCRAVPNRFRWAVLDAPQLSQRVKPRSTIEKAVAALDAQNVGFLGPAGAGKTSLACALLRAAAAKRNTIGRFATCFDIAEARRQNRLGNGEASLIATAMHAPVLLLDEIGAEKSNDLAVDEVIRFRHDNQSPLIWTSGFNRKDIADRYGAGVERRLFEGAVVICLGGAK